MLYCVCIITSARTLKNYVARVQAYFRTTMVQVLGAAVLREVTRWMTTKLRGIWPT